MTLRHPLSSIIFYRHWTVVCHSSHKKTEGEARKNQGKIVQGLHALGIAKGFISDTSLFSLLSAKSGSLEVPEHH